MLINQTPTQKEILISAQDPAAVSEGARRNDLWKRLLKQYPGAVNIPAAFVRSLGIYGGMGQGVFVDKKRVTGAITKNGVAVSVNWSRWYEMDGPDGDFFIYSYPRTRRAGRSDANEVEAVKNAKRLDLPLFFIDSVTHPTTRDVRLAWVVDWDDGQQAFVLVFTADKRSVDLESDKGTFELDKTRDDRVSGSVKRRRGQKLFRYTVFKRYGPICAFCGLTVPGCLDAAHIKGSAQLGTDDARNGMVLCKVHHAMLDQKLVAVNPSTLEIETNTPQYSLADLRISYRSIRHLRQKPDITALEWLHAQKDNEVIPEP